MTTRQGSSHLGLFVAAVVLALGGGATLAVDVVVALPTGIFVAALVALVGGVIVLGRCAYMDARTSGRGLWTSLGGSVCESVRFLIGLILA